MSQVARWVRSAAELGALGKYAEAARLFEQAALAEPHWAMHWANLGTALRAAGEFDRAVSAYEEAAARGAASVDFLLNFALLHLDRFEYRRARILLRQAAAQAPTHPEIRYFLAVCDFQDVEDAAAQETLADWRELDGLTPDALARIGTMLLHLGLTQEAEEALRRALLLDPASELATIRLAQVLERSNRVADARRELDRLPALSSPEAAEMVEERLAVEARLAERDDDPDSARRLYEALLARPLPDHERYHVLYPLGRVLDRLGRTEEAMSVLADAHASQVRFLERAAPHLLAASRSFAIADHPCDPADVVSWATDPGPDEARSPIFVVGFPRSGTTLLEQMLDAHPGLASMDEQPFLQNAIDHVRRLGVAYPEQLGRLDAAALEGARAHYWEQVRRKVSLGAGQRLVDKNPLNLLRLAAIRRLFPRAHVILAVRHPLDVLVSNYMQHYRAPEIAVMCRSLESLAEGYVRAFNYWYAQQALLQPHVLELVYEDFVSDFPGQARRIAGFLGLPWDDAMLAPGAHALKRGYISTPSYAQVVEPVNRRAVGRWQKYAAYLGPARARVQTYLERWRYVA